jgi:hypothetical protein
MTIHNAVTKNNRHLKYKDSDKIYIIFQVEKILRQSKYRAKKEKRSEFQTGVLCMSLKQIASLFS